MAEYKSVPVEPTEKMIDAGVAMALQVSVHGYGGWSKYVRALYQQMLSHAPESAEPEHIHGVGIRDAGPMSYGGRRTDRERE